LTANSFLTVCSGVLWILSTLCHFLFVTLPMAGTFLSHGPEAARLITIEALSFGLPRSVFTLLQANLKMDLSILRSIARHGNREAELMHLMIWNLF